MGIFVIYYKILPTMAVKKLNKNVTVVKKVDLSPKLFLVHRNVFIPNKILQI